MPFIAFENDSGMGVIQRMGMVVTDKDGKPKYPITIHKARAYRGLPPEDDDDDDDAEGKLLESGHNAAALATTGGPN